jgi:hypothetical protein
MSGLKINYQKSEVFAMGGGGHKKIITKLLASSTVMWGFFLSNTWVLWYITDI